jgi:hypothetical protein
MDDDIGNSYQLLIDFLKNTRYMCVFTSPPARCMLYINFYFLGFRYFETGSHYVA